MLRAISVRHIPQRSKVYISRNLTTTNNGDNSTSSPKNQNSIPNVPGLSMSVCDVPNKPVGFAGSTKDSDYKCPEYFCYNVDSFADSFVEIQDFRLPAPSAKKK